MNTKNSSTQWSDPVRYIALVAFVALILVVCSMAKESMTLLLLALLTAYILSPLVRFLTNVIHLKRNLAVVLSYLILLLLIVAFFLIIIPIITENVQSFMNKDWLITVNQVRNWIHEISINPKVQNLEFLGYQVDLSVPLQQLKEQIDSLTLASIDVTALVPDMSAAVQRIFSASTNFLGSVITVLIMTLTGIMASIHFCKDGYRFKDWFINLFEERYRPEVSELARRLAFVWNNYFAGEIKLMLIVGALTAILYAAAGIHWALLLGIIAGFCEVVPNIGPILACVPAALSAAVFGSRWLPFNNFVIVLVAVGISILIQQAENIFIVPRIMGDALDLHPVIITIGILVLSSRLGIFGALLASPIIGLSREILHFAICKIRKEDPYSFSEIK